MKNYYDDLILKIKQYYIESPQKKRNLFTLLLCVFNVKDHTANISQLCGLYLKSILSHVYYAWQDSLWPDGA